MAAKLGPMSALVLKLATSGGLLAVAVGFVLVGRALDAKSPTWGNVVTLIALALVVWVPRGARDVVLAIPVGLVFSIAFGVVTGAIVGVAFYAGAQYLPGGASVALLAIIAIAALFQVRATYLLLRRRARARKLVPGERPIAEVAIGGRAIAKKLVECPGSGREVVAWWAVVGDLWTSDETIHLDTDAGPAMVGPAGCKLDFDDDRKTIYSGSKVADVARELGAKKLGDDDTIEVSWLEPDDQLYVVGRPSWEASPIGGGYRDAPFVPLFRSADKQTVYLSIGTPIEVRRSSIYRLALWLGWGTACAAIAALQSGYSI